jgi:SAM-dependent methyltransferase
MTLQNSPQGNTAANRYGSIAAEIYDIDKPVGALPDTAYYLARLADVDGPILEPACGSGRTLVPLLRAGHDVAGFDTSEEMLARCRQRCAAEGFAPELSRQRFEDFTIDRPFAAIVLPVGSFTLIDDFERAMAVLRRFHANLIAGGRLIVDIASIVWLADAGDDRRRWTADNGDLLTLEGKRTATDWLTQRAESLLRYERWRDNALVDSQLEPMVQRYWGIEEFRLALEASGFAEVTVTGGYRPGRAPGSAARAITFEAIRN